MSDATSAARRAAWTRLLGRGVRLRCPNCGGGSVLMNWFRVRECCPRCGLRLDRGQHDYFIGAYTINLIVAELLMVGVLALVLVARWPDVPWDFLQYGGVALMVLGPMATYPFSKMLWLACDLVFRPLSPEDLAPGAGGT